MTAVEPDAHPDLPSGAAPSPPRTLTGICPYLVEVDGAWRSATVAREHRCHAVSPPAPLAAEKQRRLCLTGDYPLCATFEAARAARPVAHDRLPTLPRPLARTAPVIHDHGRLAVAVPELRADRTTVQAVLIALLVIAFAAIVLAKLASGGVSAGTGASPGASSQPAVAASSAPSQSSDGSPAVTPAATAAGSGIAGSPAASGGTQTYKVKSGDTLVGIAAKFGTTTKAIADLNGITNPASLKVGQVLQIP